MKTVGFIGTGVMGKSMVRNLMKQGFELYIYSRTKEKALELIAEGAIWCDSVAQCATGRDTVITIVGYPQDVEQVYFGEGGILRHASHGAYLIDMTTTSPQLSQRIDEEARVRGLHALDAPVSGGDIGAQKGTLAIMVGGEKDDFDACAALFAAMGKSVIHEGPAGSGQHVKMANQIAIAGAVSGVCEAVAYAKAVGVDVGRMLETIGGGAAGSWQLQNLGPKMACGDETPGFFIKHFIKDMQIATAEAERAGLHLNILRDVCAIYLELEAAGKGEKGTQAIIGYYQK